MEKSSSRIIAPIGLVTGSLLGMAGSLVASSSLRGLLWGFDGIFLIVATALLAVYHLRKGNEMLAAGFLVFVVAQTLVLSVAAMDPAVSGPVFAAGVGLWATSLIMVSTSRILPSWLRVAGTLAASLFALVAVQMFLGQELTPLSKPLPTFAYPFLVITLIGWAWIHYRDVV